MVTVLVVDDDPGIRSMLVEVLSIGGYPTKIAEHGGPAILRILNSHQPLVVLLGILMPYMNGQEVLRAVAAHPEVAARHRIILVTALRKDSVSGELAELLERLRVPHIEKPFTVEQILNAVAQAVEELRALEMDAHLQGRQGPYRSGKACGRRIRETRQAYARRAATSRPERAGVHRTPLRRVRGHNGNESHGTS